MDTISKLVLLKKFHTHHHESLQILASHDLQQPCIENGLKLDLSKWRKKERKKERKPH
jgi:hypothetical protein